MYRTRIFFYLQFPTQSYPSSFHFGDKTFAQNFAARPFCMTFEGKQFVFEICRKHDTGQSALLLSFLRFLLF